MLGAAGSVRLVGFVDRETAQGPADAPLPRSLPRNWPRRSVRPWAGTTIRDDSGSSSPGPRIQRPIHDEPGKPEEQAPILVSFRGRARYESDGIRWRRNMIRSSRAPARPDCRPTDGRPVRRHAAAMSWAGLRGTNLPPRIEPSARQWTPRGVIWERSEELVRMLEEPDRAKVSLSVAQRVVDGMRCYVVEVKGLVDREWGSETIISPRQGYLPTARKWTLRGKTYSSHVLQGVHEVVPGIWVPDRIEDESITVRKDGASRLDRASGSRSSSIGRGRSHRRPLSSSRSLTEWTWSISRKARRTIMTPGGRRSARCSGRSSAGRSPTSHRC